MMVTHYYTTALMMVVMVLVMAAVSQVLDTAPTPPPSLPSISSPQKQPSLNNFCARTLSARSRPPCPPPPKQILDISALSGTYFEIGSTACYKLRYELGLGSELRTDVNVTLRHNNNTSTTAEAYISIRSTGIPVMFGRQPLQALARIANSSSAICTNAARMCAITSSYSHLWHALRRISSVAHNISRSVSYDFSTLLDATSSVNASIEAVNEHLDGISRSMQTITRIAACLSQQPVDISEAESRSMLYSLRSTVLVAAEQASEFGRVMINNLTYANALVTQVSSHLLFGAADIQEVSVNALLVLLREAVSLVNEQIKSVTNRLMSIQNLLGGMGGPLVDMLDASYKRFAPVNIPTTTGGGGGGGDSGFTLGDTLKNTRSHRRREELVTISSGTGVVENSTTNGGNNISVELNLKMGNGNKTRGRRGRALSKRYRIIALEPKVNMGASVRQYSELVLYSCASVEEEEEEEVPSTNEFILLSSTPNVSSDIVSRLLEVAAAQGVYTDCDAAFVPTLHASDNCNIAVVRPSPSSGGVS